MSHEPTDEELARALRKLKRYVSFRVVAPAAGVSYRTVYRLANNKPDYDPQASKRLRVVALLSDVGAFDEGVGLTDVAKEIERRARRSSPPPSDPEPPPQEAADASEDPGEPGTKDPTDDDEDDRDTA